MLFNSYIFIFLFFPIVLIGYYGLNYIGREKAALAFLCGMSMWFYGYSNIYYMLLLVVSILLNYLITYGMEKSTRRKRRRLLLWAGILLNLGNLFFFKYYDFFIWNINSVFKSDLPFLRLALPIGISFFTFQQLSYVIDFYRGECERYSLLEYANYVSYFPQLIAGPIVYHSELIPQFRDRRNRHFSSENFSRGLYAFACGLGKKVLIADVLSKVVNIGYASPWGLSSISVLLVMICYTLQIYFDFSGYSDMAYGLGYMCNVVLPVNFNSPYKADGIADFWKRWHITLTRFFTKYVYIPLGGNRCGKVRTFLNSMIVFLVSGFWHGANWTFIVWGGVNGLAVSLDHAIGNRLVKIPRYIRRAVSFVFCMFAWTIFRASDLSEAFYIIRRLFVGGFGELNPVFAERFNDMTEIALLYRFGVGRIVNVVPWFFLLLFLIVVLYVTFTAKNTQEKVAAMKFSKKETFITVFLLVWSIMSLTEISEFLYYNF